jgi:hypothetical protein
MVLGGMVLGGMVLMTGLILVVTTFRPDGGSLGLAQHQGALAKDGAHYLVDGHAVNVGPDWYIANNAARADFDRDGEVGTVAAELDGLVGMTVALGVEVELGGEPSLFTINGQAYRDIDGGRPPWAGGPHANRP